MANSSQSLPNPFQNSAVPPNSASIAVPKTISSANTVQSDTSLFHGYRSNFNINQQKEIYQRRISEQQQVNYNERGHQKGKFNWNQQKPHNRPSRNSANDRPTAVNQHHGSESSNWCELCECGFKYPKQLEKHQDEHEKCWFDNCNFVGHSMLLKKHIEAQHNSGFFQRIGKVESEEDIMKWREERRKRYPTKENIEARRLAQEERLKRGERINEPNNRFGDMKNRKSAKHRSFDRQNQNNSEAGQNDELKNKNGASKNQRNKRNERKRRRTRNLNKHGKGDDGQTEEGAIDAKKSDEQIQVKTNIISDDKVISTEKAPTEKAVQSTSGLAAIMGMYGSDSESDDNEVDAMCETQSKENVSGSANDKCDDAVTDDPLLENRKRSASTECEQPSKFSKIALEMPEEGSKQDDETIRMEKMEESTTEVFTNENTHNESEDEAPEEQPIQRNSNDSEQTHEDKSGPTEVKPIEKPKTSRMLANEKVFKKRTVLDMTRKIRNQNTLLEKLLQKDIRHERNVLLQCVRYVVENKFFGIGQQIDERNEECDDNIK